MVRKYKSTFQAPLSASKQEALQLLFDGEFDPMAMNLDMVVMDEVSGVSLSYSQISILCNHNHVREV